MAAEHDGRIGNNPIISYPSTAKIVHDLLIDEKQQMHRESDRSHKENEERREEVQQHETMTDQKLGEGMATIKRRTRQKKFFASKTVVEQLKSQQKDRLPSKIIYMHVHGETTERYTESQLNRMPVTFAMRLNDVGQQHRARVLLERENQKVRSAARVSSPKRVGRRSKSRASGQKQDSGSPNAEKDFAKVSNKRSRDNSAFASYTRYVSAKSTSTSSPSGSATIEPTSSAYPLTYQGPPTIKGIDWPPGWIQHSHERPCKTRYDQYWYTPILKKRLRSMIDVKRMLSHLARNGNNEEDAWAAVRIRK